MISVWRSQYYHMTDKCVQIYAALQWQSESEAVVIDSEYLNRLRMIRWLGQWTN